MRKSAAIRAIEKRGILLVFPIQNKKEPPSLWYEFWPRSTMKWEWDQDGDQRVASLWHLRAELSCSREVVYAKWYDGRATFFSKQTFVCLLTILSQGNPLHPQAQNLLDLLLLNSPLSTKKLKLASHLKGKVFEAEYTRALKQLWNRLIIVGFGEIDDGAFPSLAIGATQVLFEELWEKSQTISSNEALAELQSNSNLSPLFLKKIKALAGSR